MAPSALLKAMSNNKRKRVAQNEEPDFEEYEPADQNDTSSSESEEESDEDSEEEDDSEIDEDDENRSAFASANGSLSKSASAKGKGKARAGENGEEDITSKQQGTFKSKTLVLSSRGITHRMRHMMKDVASLLPHSKTGA
jgi:ribosome biogenesis protein BRX1